VQWSQLTMVVHVSSCYVATIYQLLGVCRIEYLDYCENNILERMWKEAFVAYLKVHRNN
jgi:hypothetical protein